MKRVVGLVFVGFVSSGICAQKEAQIKGIPPEVFAQARLEQQISALQLNKYLRQELANKVQKIRDFRSELEIERKILLLKLRDNEIAITASKRAEKEVIKKEEANRIDKIYKELGLPNPANAQNNQNNQNPKNSQKQTASMQMP
ncbi:hypothetical protein [Helicobacter sp. T3_23-1056]